MIWDSFVFSCLLVTLGILEEERNWVRPGDLPPDSVLRKKLLLVFKEPYSVTGIKLGSATHKARASTPILSLLP